jgi:ribosomal protein S18 acetylase RimI-like enzyme
MMLRRAQKADGAAVFALLWTARDDIPLRPEFYNDGNKKWILEQCSKRRVWVIEEDEVVIGAMLLRGQEIFYLVVSPPHRRKGFARILLRKAKRKRRWAKVQPANAAIIRLLESEGFRYDPDRLTASGWDTYRLPSL